jgi:indolepyruvate ferredoxin oxidoreductase beta subunit
LRFVSEKTLVIMSDERIQPTELSAKMRKYPSLDEIERKIRHFTKKIITVKTAELAKKAGNVLTENIVLVGALAAAGMLPVKDESIMQALRELVPEKHSEINVKAFKLGYSFVKNSKIRF